MKKLERILLVSLVCFFGCGKPDTLFRLVPSSESGLEFTNSITEDDTLNVVNFTNIYNGGGVAIGDFDNDGLQDVLLAGNMVPSRLFLNKGNLEFEDVTEEVNLIYPQRWVTGTSLVDINADGWLDIYLCVSGPNIVEDRTNMLFINKGLVDGKLSFQEVGEACGLADNNFSTQAAFFDYDKDGDLDAYLLTNGQEKFNHNTRRPRKVKGEGISTDHFYRNDGVGEDGLPHFTDVSQEAGITIEGYGLGIAITDINRDGWLDVYCANDFISNDLLWINNGDGTFTNQISESIRHQTFNGMGIEIADFNNDEWQDIVVVDMLPETHAGQKVMMADQNVDLYLNNARFGYEDQYMRNTVQLNTGLNPQGHVTFSEIGMLSGIHKTEWSWAPLAADFDHDGLRDLFISNGYPKNIIDMDYMVYLNEMAVFGNDQTVRTTMHELVKKLAGLEVPNFMYQNVDGLTFKKVSQEWGFQQPSISNGAAYADLDNDGDLELVVNNVNGKSFLYENQLMQQKKEGETGKHFIKIKLEGDKGNRFGQGAKLRAIVGGQHYFLEQNLYRGFQSTLSPELHIGLGNASQVDSLEVEWPDGKYQVITNVKVDQTIVLKNADAKLENASHFQLSPSKNLFEPVNGAFGINFRHQEQDYLDFKQTALLPHMHSTNGPGVAVADVNGDGLDDFFVGNAGSDTSALFLQKSQSPYFTHVPFTFDIKQEDMGSVFFDADQDGDQDLYVVSGGSERIGEVDYYQDRLYLNDGKGNFSSATDRLPTILQSGSCVAVADIDADGDLDIFRGGRLTPGSYPMPGKSYVILNDGNGKFHDATEEIAPAIREMGMICAAIWSDVNGDNQPDLITGGEWEPIRIFINQKGKLQPINDAFLANNGIIPSVNGWWNSLIAHDFDQDGDMDLVAGNMGLNTKLKASASEPVRIYGKDFDNSGNIDPIMTQYLNGVEHLTAPRDALIAQIAGMRRRFPRYAEFAVSDMSVILNEKEREGTLTLFTDQFQSCYFENDGSGHFTVKPLPIEAQFAPIFGLLADDFDADGLPDILLTGNFYGNETNVGKYDAFNGLMLKGDGKGNFKPLSFSQTGFYAGKDAKGLAKLTLSGGETMIIQANNNDILQAWKVNQKGKCITASPNDWAAEIVLENGQKYRVEFPYGSGYLSHSTRKIYLPESVKSIVWIGWDGKKKEVDL